MLKSFVRPTPMTDRLYEYVLSVSLREPEAFRALREETAKLSECEWQIAPEQGPLLAMLVELMGATNCLEVGTFTGYSAAWVARALPSGGTITCCELNETYAAIARKHWSAAGLTSKIDLRLGPALDTVRALAGRFVRLRVHRRRQIELRRLLREMPRTRAPRRAHRHRQHPLGRQGRRRECDRRGHRRDPRAEREALHR